MQIFSLDRNAPNAFVLVPDGAFSKEQLVKDQVWILNLDSTDPQPFYLSTTYGLRAKSMRVFPNIIIENQRISEPENFSSLPRVISYSPSSVQITAEYQNNIEFLFTFFFLEPEIVTGTVQIKNSRKIATTIILQLAVNLVPMGKGQPSHPDKSGINQFLTGKTDQLEPVLFMTGGPTAINNPFPALSIQLNAEPGVTQELSWALVSKEKKLHSFEKAKQVITSGWQEAFKQHKMDHEERTIGIKTGNQDWDAAFLLSQVNLNTHILKYKQESDSPHFIKVRLPDHSSIPDNHETAPAALSNLEFNHLCQVMLPAQPDIAIHLLEKQIASQVERLENKAYEMDFRNGYSRKCCPMLGSILLEIYEITNDDDILERHFSDLDLLFKSWVIDPTTKTEKKALHWDDPCQLQIDSGLFSFDIWDSYCKGLDIKKAESPALYAMLFREAKALQKISKILGERSQQRFYNHWQKKCHQHLENCWDEDAILWGYKDIETHQSPPRVLFHEGYTLTDITINQTLTKPQRLQIRIYSSDEHTRACTIRIMGISPEGQPLQEIFKSPGIFWANGRAHLITEYLYGEVESISFEGLDPKDKFVFETADYSQTDITCFLPLWANAGNETHLQKTSQALMDSQNYELTFGIPETWESQNPLPEGLPIRVNLLWNSLILEGLLNQGQSSQAAELFTNLMWAINQGLKDYDGFFSLFDNKNGLPVGQCNAITGLVPVQLFLKIAGIKLLSPTRVALWGINPFPWPIEIQWKGLSLWKEKEHTKITFPNGKTAEHNTEKPVLITSE